MQVKMEKEGFISEKTLLFVQYRINSTNRKYFS